jgi:hypothetical protein
VDTSSQGRYSPNQKITQAAISLARSLHRREYIRVDKPDTSGNLCTHYYSKVTGLRAFNQQ